jgi:hypothetical protein
MSRNPGDQIGGGIGNPGGVNGNSGGVPGGGSSNGGIPVEVKTS